MAHFQLEQELQAALRLDTTINFNTSALNRSSRQRTSENGSAKKRTQSAGRNSSLLNGSLNRSRILGIQQPQNVTVKRSTSTGRLAATSPGRNGAKNRTPSAGRNGGDRFIPNRSTTDMEMAHFSLANSGDSFAGQMDSGDSDISEQQRIQLSQQTADILNGNKESRILSFKSKAPAADEAHANSLKVLYSTGKPKAPNAAKTRQVQHKPER